MKTTPEIGAAMAFMGATLAETGGGCTAWELDHGESVTLITRVDDACAPLALSEPCRVCTYDSDVGQLEATPISEDIFPTVLDALRDIYGPIEGEPLPEIFREVTP